MVGKERKKDIPAQERGKAEMLVVLVWYTSRNGRAVGAKEQSIVCAAGYAVCLHIAGTRSAAAVLLIFGAAGILLALDGCGQTLGAATGSRRLRGINAKLAHGGVHVARLQRCAKHGQSLRQGGDEDKSNSERKPIQVKDSRTFLSSSLSLLTV